MTVSKSSLKVAVAQIETALGDLPHNLRKHLDVIGSARAAGHTVLVFPELSLVGHSAGTDAPRLALSGNARELALLAEASGEMLTIVGFIQEAPGALYYNSAAALQGGRVVFCHRKVNLATYGRLEDGKHYAAGRRIDVVEVGRPWRAGVLICSDLWSPPLVHIAAVRGATLLLAPISSAEEAVGAEFDNPSAWAVTAKFHAMTYGFFLALANRTGAEGDLTFWGGSRILDPFGGVLTAAEGAGEQLVSAVLDFELVRRARYLLPTVRDANPGMLARELLRADRDLDRQTIEPNCSDA
jgi:predicted amidohydrolase